MTYLRNISLLATAALLMAPLGCADSVSGGPPDDQNQNDVVQNDNDPEDNDSGENNDQNDQNNDSNENNDEDNDDQNNDENNGEDDNERECYPETDPQLCDQNDLQCGAATLTDQCGNEREIHCGDCPLEDCQDNQCACVPLNCKDEAAASTCGVVSDGCGGEILCNVDCENPVGIGAYHSCVAEDDGGVRCWGRNDNGQLGTETDDDGQPVDASTQGLVVDELEDEHVLQVFAGEQHTCTKLLDGEVMCWGSNDDMQLTELAGDISYSPVEITSIDGPANVIGTGGFHTCAELGPGQMQCWGENWDGQLGTGDNDWYETPVDVNWAGADDAPIRKFDGGPWFSCYQDGDDDLYCWGENTFGQIGNQQPYGDDFGMYNEPMKVVVDIEQPIQDYSAGGTFIEGAGVGYTISGFTCAIDDTGSLYCWGYNGYGQLGIDPDAEDKNHSEYAEEIDGLVSPQKVAAGGEHACAIEENGEVRCWGYNEYGQLGDGTTDDTYEPVLVDGLGDAAIEIYAGTFHTCALLEEGDFKCWGRNDDGQLGDGTTDIRPTPVSVFQ